MKTKVPILSLRPTQFAIGMLEVDEKIAEAKTLSKKDLRRYVKETRVPVVVSPDGELYVVDRHHFLSVCYHMGMKKAYVEVVKDFTGKKMTYTKFWKWMESHRSMYPFCQFGEGPRKALYLPKDIRSLSDDPYRSLAWFVRKAGAFENSDRNFAEFQWANFFRKKGLLDKKGTLGMPEALVEAAKLAQSKEAKGLPGYGQLKLEEKWEVLKKAKKRGKIIAKDAKDA
jgi:hypothetical protein